MAYRNYANNVGFIVNPNGSGDFTTITAASAAATSGTTIFIAPGIYTENISPKSGVLYTAAAGSIEVPSVQVIGKWTISTAGTYSISNLFLTTNSDFVISVSGSGLCSLNVSESFISALNATAISYTNSNASSGILFDDCFTNNAAGTVLYSHTGAGALGFTDCYFGNSSVTSLSPTVQTSGVSNFYYTHMDIPIGVSGTGVMGSFFCTYNSGFVNNSGLQVGAGGIAQVHAALLSGGTAPALTIGAGAVVTLMSPSISSANTNAIAGTGTLNTRNIVFYNTSSTIEGTLTVNTLVGFP